MKKHTIHSPSRLSKSLLLLSGFFVVASACSHAKPDEVSAVIQQAKAHGARIYAKNELATAQKLLAQARQKPDPANLNLAMRKAKQALGRAARLSQRAKNLGKQARTSERRKREAVEQARLNMRSAQSRKAPSKNIHIPQNANIISVDLLSRRMQMGDNLLLIDLRQGKQFKQGHITGALNARPADLGHRRFSKNLDLIIYNDDDKAQRRQINQALMALASQGARKISILDGGFAHWKQKGLPWSQPQSHKQDPGLIQATKLAKELRQSSSTDIKLAVIDVRPRARYQNGHLPGARNFPLQSWPKQLPKLDDPAVIYADDDLSAAQAAAQLSQNSEHKIRYLSGGTRAWALAGQTLAGHKAQSQTPKLTLPTIQNVSRGEL